MITDAEHNTARINITAVPPAAQRKQKKKKCRAAYGATDTKYQKAKLPLPLMRSATAREFKGSGVGPPPTAGAVPLCPVGQILLWGLRPLYPSVTIKMGTCWHPSLRSLVTHWNLLFIGVVVVFLSVPTTPPLFD